MSYWWWRPRNRYLEDIYEDIKKREPIDTPSYPWPIHVFDLQCQYCKASWHSEEVSADAAEREQTRLQQQYKKHLTDFHANVVS